MRPSSAAPAAPRPGPVRRGRPQPEQQDKRPGPGPGEWCGCARRPPRCERTGRTGDCRDRMPGAGRSARVIQALLYDGGWRRQCGAVTRRTADQRHLDSAPRSHDDLLDVLMAFHHPTRRWLAELLEIEGPASVGRLAARTGLAVGSVSHHLKALHRHGFIEPAPDLARDTRESWWRVRRPLSLERRGLRGRHAGRRVARPPRRRTSGSRCARSASGSGDARR